MCIILWYHLEHQPEEDPATDTAHLHQSTTLLGTCLDVRASVFQESGKELLHWGVSCTGSIWLIMPWPLGFDGDQLVSNVGGHDKSGHDLTTLEENRLVPWETGNFNSSFQCGSRTKIQLSEQNENCHRKLSKPKTQNRMRRASVAFSWYEMKSDHIDGALFSTKPCSLRLFGTMMAKVDNSRMFTNPS